MTYKVGDVLEHDMDFDNSGPLGPYADYPIIVEAVHDDGTVDLTWDPHVLPMTFERVDPRVMGLRVRKGKEAFDAAIASRFTRFRK
jgi:hypothetical protein